MTATVESVDQVVDSDTVPLDHFLKHDNLGDLIKAIGDCGFKALGDAPDPQAFLTVNRKSQERLDTPSSVYLFVTDDARHQFPENRLKLRPAMIVSKDRNASQWTLAWPTPAGQTGEFAALCGRDGERLRRAVARRAAVRLTSEEAALRNCLFAITRETLLKDDGYQFVFTLTSRTNGMAVVVTLTIDRTGNVTTEVTGAKGAQCTELTEGVEKALGKVTDKKMTAEYYQTQAAAAATVNA